MPRIIEETSDFVKCCKKYKVSSNVVDALKLALADFHFSITSKTDRIFISDSRKSSLWDIRVGNPSKNQGSRGGYRVLAYYIEDEDKFYLDYINEKDNSAKPLGKKEYSAWEIKLKKYLRDNF